MDSYISRQVVRPPQILALLPARSDFTLKLSTPIQKILRHFQALLTAATTLMYQGPITSLTFLTSWWKRVLAVTNITASAGRTIQVTGAPHSDLMFRNTCCGWSRLNRTPRREHPQPNFFTDTRITRITVLPVLHRLAVNLSG